MDGLECFLRVLCLGVNGGNNCRDCSSAFDGDNDALEEGGPLGASVCSRELNAVPFWRGCVSE